MKKCIISLLLIAGVTLISGCANTVYTLGLRNPDQPSMKAKWPVYEPTRQCAEWVGLGFRNVFTDYVGTDPYETAYAVVSLPISVIELPCEVVLDTVFLPWDIGWQIVRANEKD